MGIGVQGFGDGVSPMAGHDLEAASIEGIVLHARRQGMQAGDQGAPHREAQLRSILRRHIHVVGPVALGGQAIEDFAKLAGAIGRDFGEHRGPARTLTEEVEQHLALGAMVES